MSVKVILWIKSRLLFRSPDVLPSQLLSFSRQIVSAMSYLAAKGYVHRDLAARNVLLSGDETCKVIKEYIELIYWSGYIITHTHI